jgi:hypothetical protein
MATKITIYPPPSDYKDDINDWIATNFIFIEDTNQSLAECIIKNGNLNLVDGMTKVFTLGEPGETYLLPQLWKNHPNKIRYINLM